MKLLLDEMYPGALAEALRAVDIQACTAVELRLAGSPDPEILAAAIEQDRALLTENVADFTRISAEHLLAGGHHHGVLIALSSRFSPCRYRLTRGRDSRDRRRTARRPPRVPATFRIIPTAARARVAVPAASGL